MSEGARIGLLGRGTVGGALHDLLGARADAVESVSGRRPEISGVLRRSEGDFDDILERSDIVVELMGGTDPARDYVLRALQAGRHVVTANKQLVAQHGDELFAAAREAGVQLRFEAAVAGVVPVIRVIQESLAATEITKVFGIVNGTTNFILDKMDSAGSGFAEVLEEAQGLGYAEADPTADVEGYDAAAKAAILASLAFHTRVTAADVHREGIAEVSAADVASARDMDSVVKLLAICELRDTDAGPAVAARVHPAMIPRSHPLASVRGAYNAVFVESDAAGQLMFYGPGAGGAPTASAVLGDLVTVARNRIDDVRGAGESAYADLAVLPMGQTITRYHVAIDVDDRAGVLASVAQTFAEHGVSIQTVRQEGHGDDAQLVVVSHRATDEALSATVETLRGLDFVHDVSSVMRVEGDQ